jgi:hypothetical protein
MVSPMKSRASQVIGFLPYWLIDKADKDYSPYLTTLAYFGLTIKPDGSIQQFTNPGESEPGWYALNSGKFDPPKDIHTSLVVFNGDPQSIDELIANPVAHAANLVEQDPPAINCLKRVSPLEELSTEIQRVQETVSHLNLVIS